MGIMVGEVRGRKVGWAVGADVLVAVVEITVSVGSGVASDAFDGWRVFAAFDSPAAVHPLAIPQMRKKRATFQPIVEYGRFRAWHSVNMSVSIIPLIYSPYRIGKFIQKYPYGPYRGSLTKFARGKAGRISLCFDDDSSRAKPL
jgi:hypothetical protein